MIDLLGANVLIVGMGISGKGSRYALEREGATCYIFDDRQNVKLPNVKLDLIVISPSICKFHSIYKFAEVNNIPLIGELELGFMLNKGEVIAVTGTNGKTTTTQLIEKILKAAGLKAEALGNIGKSFAQCASDKSYNIAVVESSSFQLESVKTFRPFIACITNISPDHLDRHGDMAEYARTKLKICENQTNQDYLILSQDDIPVTCLMGFAPKSNVIYTSTRGKVPGAYKLLDKIYCFDEFICDRDQIKMEGDHNVSNALMAIAVAKLYEVSNKIIVETLTEFETDDHRLKLVDRIDSKSYYNDSKGTNIAATIKAMKAMTGDTALILGGSDKGYEFDELFMAIPETIKKIITIGQTTKKIIDASIRCRYLDIETAENLYEAVHLAACMNVDNVLLSPATASFDMFNDYKERGQKFESIVRGLRN